MGARCQLRSLYNPYYPPFGDVDVPPRAPSMRAYLRDPSEAPTPPLYRSQPRRPLSPSSTHTHESSSHTHTHSVPTPLSTDVLPSSTHTSAPAVLHPRSTSSRVARPSTPIRVRARIQTRALCCVQRCMTLYLRSQHSRIPTICSHRTPARSRTSQYALDHDAHPLLHRVHRLWHVADPRTCLA